jgi:glycosyltransferase involved in cell wall biosynthesis
MDLFALTSRSEGMPLAVLEAWAAGLPVVASRVGGLPEMIAEGIEGVLFPVGDVTALSAALQTLVEHPAQARLLGEAGRAKAIHQFDVHVMCDNYGRHYRELLARNRGRSTPILNPST